MAAIRRLFAAALLTGLAGFLTVAPAVGQKDADQVIAPGPDAPVDKVLEWKSAEGQPYWYRLPVEQSATAAEGEAPDGKAADASANLPRADRR